MNYTRTQIEEAVEAVVNNLDLETLLNYCIEQQLEYYTGKNVDEEELDLLIEDSMCQ